LRRIGMDGFELEGRWRFGGDVHGVLHVWRKRNAASLPLQRRRPQS
jgi:hypothetical protein